MVLRGDVRWRRKARQDFAEARLKVAHEMDGELMMILTTNLALPFLRHSYNLLYRGVPIKRLDINGRHRNTCRNRERFDWETHKHMYTDDCEMAWAYKPDDITTDALRESFLQFCDECGIVFDGNWGEIPEAPPGAGNFPLGLDDEM